MSINGIGAGYPAWRETGKTQGNRFGTNFANRMTDSDTAGRLSSQRTDVRATGQNTPLEAYRVSVPVGVYSVKSAYETYESENYRIEPDNEAGCFDIYNKQGEKLGAFAYSDIKVRQDSATGKQFLISEHGTMSYDALVTDGELKEALQNVMGVEALETEAMQGFTLKTHSGTGIQYLIRNGEEGRGGKVLLQSQADIEKYEALAETYFHKYPNLVHDKNAGYIWADLEIKGLAQHTENGIVSMGFNGMSYDDNSNYKNNWSVLFSGDTYKAIFDWLQNNKGSIEEMQKFATWQDIFTAGTGNFADEVQKAEESRNTQTKPDSSAWAGDLVVLQPPDYSGFTYDSSISDKSKEEMTMDEYKQWFMNEMSKMPVSSWVSSTFSCGALVVKEEAFERMKSDPEYEQYVLNRIRTMYSVSSLPVGSNNVGYEVIGASPEECYGYAGPIGNSGSNSFGKEKSWWEKRSERMEELLEVFSGRNIVAGKTNTVSFQSVLDENMGELGLEDMLKAQYPGLKYHVLDTSKINSSLWQRNDYPFEMFFEDELDESDLDWNPTSREPSMLDAGVQARLNAARGKYAIVVPPALEEKLKNNLELSQSIMNKISALIKEQDTVPSSMDSFTITLDNDGNISNYRLSGGGGEITITKRSGQKSKDEETEEIKEQERNQRLAAKRALQRKEQLEKAESDKIYQQSLRKAMRLYGQNLL